MALANVIRIVSLPSEKRSMAEMLNAVPWIRKKSKVFAEIAEDLVVEVIKNCKLGVHGPNRLVIRQGTKGDTFFVLLSGRASVYVQDQPELLPLIATLNDGHEGNAAADKQQSSDKLAALEKALGRKVFTYSPGASFGELALIQENSIRNASILTDEKCNFMVIDRDLYNMYLKSHHQREMALKIETIEKYFLFSNWSRRHIHLMVMSLRKDVIDADETIVKQGDQFKALYFLKEGSAKVACQPKLHYEHFQHFFIRSIPLPNKFKNPAEYEKRIEEDSDIHQVYSDLQAEQFNKVRSNFKALKPIDVSITQSGSCIGEFELSLGLERSAFTYTAASRCELLILDLSNLERIYNSRNRLSRQRINTTDSLLQVTYERLQKRLELVPSLSSLMLFRRAYTYIDWQRKIIDRIRRKSQRSTQNSASLPADADIEQVLRAAAQAAKISFIGHIDPAGAAALAHHERHKAAWAARLRQNQQTYKYTYSYERHLSEPRSKHALQRDFAYTNYDEVGLRRRQQRAKIAALQNFDDSRMRGWDTERSVKSKAQQMIDASRFIGTDMSNGLDLNALSSLYKRYLRHHGLSQSTGDRKSRCASAASTVYSRRSGGLSEEAAAEEDRLANDVESQIGRFVRDLQKCAVRSSSAAAMFRDAENDSDADANEYQYDNDPDSDDLGGEANRNSRSRTRNEVRAFPYKLNRHAYNPGNLPKPGAKVLLQASKCKTNSKFTVNTVDENNVPRKTELNNPMVAHEHVRSYVIPEAVVPYLRQG